MHLTFRRYSEFGARMYEMVFRKVEAGLVPKLKALPGFRVYCAFLSEDGDGVSVTVFDTANRPPGPTRRRWRGCRTTCSTCRPTRPR